MHIHTVLSPCGGLDMSPVNIIRQSAMKRLDIIGITDHNSTKHCRSAQQLGSKYGITVLAGVEINTKEEIHCLTFFENMDKADRFQQFIDAHLPVIINKPEIFGYQYVVNEKEDIIDEESRLLAVALDVSIDQVAEEVYRLNGIFIPAHINRGNNSIYSQLGFLPKGLKAHALEVALNRETGNFLSEHPEVGKYRLVTNSDAHNLERVGEVTTDYFIKKPVFSEIRLALGNEQGRKITTL